MADEAMESTGKANGAHPPIPKLKDGFRRTFSEDLKRAVIARVKAGETAVTLGTELGISASVIRRWVAAGVTKQSKRLLPGVSVGRSGRKQYSDEFQQAAVARLLKGEAATSISKSLKIHDSMLYGWKRKWVSDDMKSKTADSSARYTEEFKREAVRRLKAGENAKALSAELGVHNSTLYAWRTGYQGQRLDATVGKAEAAFPARGPQPQNIKDAISFLRHAKNEVHEALARGDIKEMDQAHLLSQLALNALLKGT